MGSGVAECFFFPAPSPFLLGIQPSLRCHAPLPHRRFTDQDQVQSSTSLMWPSRGAHDAEGRATCGAWEPPLLRRLRMLAASVFIFLFYWYLG
ncbi:hypothetical protein ES319_A05G414100v1 [Gossypium barbadense]|uniref:Uncharacterized protein n=1 Tax=Gossypium barbadense TaxID=3634 RepID=A0A5J5VZY1_GOSBA|nr:hypothetical protein ES319_A05G414100v1 [Gossypium barbadense]